MRARFSLSQDKQQGGRAVAVAALVAGWLLLASPWLSGKVTIPWDGKAHFLPQLQFLAASWAKGESAAWAPYVFAGHPQIADPQSLIFSPPFALLAWLDPTPSAWAADATLFLMVLAGALAMLQWMIDKGWQPAAAVLSALSFAFGAAMAWRIQHVGQVMSLVYVPVTLLLLDRALDRKSIPYGAAAGLAAALLTLGRDQVALLSLYLLVAYTASRLLLETNDRRDTLRAAIRPLGAAMVVGAAVIALPILMTALVAGDSNRPEIDFEGAGRGSLHPALFLTMFAPDVFGSSGNMGEYWGPPSGRWPVGLFIAQNMGQMYLGALPALLIVWGAASGVLWRSDIRLFSIALIIMIIYGLGWYTPGFKLMHWALPGVDLYRRPADAVFLIGFLASVLAGYSLNALLQATSLSARPWIATAGAIAAAFATMIALAIHFDVLASAWPAITLPVVFFLLAAAIAVGAPQLSKSSPYIATVLVASMLVADLAWSNRPGGATGLPPKMYAVLDPETPNDTITEVKSLLAATASDTRRDRAELVGFGFHWPNASLTHQIEQTLGYNPLRLAAYTNATGAGDHAGLIEQKQFSPLYPSYKSTLARLLGLGVVATSAPIEQIDKALKPGDARLVARTADGYVYEIPGAMPRVMFATAALSADFDELIASGAWPNVDYASTVLLAHPSAAPVAARRPGQVRIAAYHNASVTIEVDSPDGGWVVLNDVWQPWWYATIDGVETPLLRANGIFRAVAAPPGRHTIEMTFRPVRGALEQLAGAR